MSRQINFFADPADNQRVHAWLLGEFPDIKVIRGVRGTLSDLKPHEPSQTSFLTDPDQLIILPVFSLKDVYYEPVEGHAGEYFINVRRSRVIEYTPSVWIAEQQVLKVGRVYWAYSGKLSAEGRKQISRIFRWFESSSVLIPGSQHFRIFGGAARSAPKLQYWLGDPEPNRCLFPA